MKSGLIYISVLLIAANTLAAEVSLDVHVHDQSDSTDEISRDRIKSAIHGRILHAFILSNSFQWGNSVSEADRLGILNDMKHTANLIADNSDELTGLCGVRLNWSNLNDLTDHCLNLSNMKGLKLRMASGERGITYYKSQFLDLILKQKNSIKVVLIHLPTGFSKIEMKNIENSKLVDDELKTLIETAALFPEIIFIVAHSFNNPIAVDRLAVYKLKNKISNIFLDISNVAGSTTNQPTSDFQYQDYISAWKNFGLNHVLFGSDIESHDSPAQAKTTIEFEINSIKNNPLISTEDKNKILHDNGLKVLKYVRPDLFLKVEQ